MMCQSGNVRTSGVTGCTCGCCGCGCGPFSRRFFSKSEEMEWVENYRKQLRLELAAVEEQIKECKEG